MPGFFTDGELASDPGSIFDYDVTAGEAFGSGFGRQFDTNPLALVARQARYLNDDLQNLAGGGVDWVDQEKAAGEVQSRGLDLKIPKGGIARHELDMLQYLKQREIEQNTTSARTRGVGPTAAGFAGGLAASLTDPVNVASGFIPIVNQVRYAQWLARAGEGVFARAAVRAGAGAIEGAVGAAIIEPIVYAGATSEQLDYGLMDSFLNVTLGGVLGGGLHVIGGAVYDRASRGASAPDVEAALRDAAANMPEATQREMFQSAVAAIERGEPVDVEPILARTADESDVWSDEQIDAHFGRRERDEAEIKEMYATMTADQIVADIASRIGVEKRTAQEIGARGGEQAIFVAPGGGLYDVGKFRVDFSPENFTDAQVNTIAQDDYWRGHMDFKRIRDKFDVDKQFDDAGVAGLEVTTFSGEGVAPSLSARAPGPITAEQRRAILSIAKSIGLDRGALVAKSGVDGFEMISLTGGVAAPESFSPLSRINVLPGRARPSPSRQAGYISSKPRDLFGLMEQAKADRTQEAFTRQFVDVESALARVPERDRPGFTITHVSPHKFDAPRLDEGDIGRTSGGWEEGAGLYGSNNPEVVRVHQDLYTDKSSPQAVARAFVDDMGGDVAATIENLKSALKDAEANPGFRKNAEKALAYLEKNGAPPAPEVFTYEWKVNGDLERDFVDFRKPINEQHPDVIAKLRAAGIDPNKDQWFKTWVQKQMNNEVYSFAKDPDAARANALSISKRLREAGLKGAVYGTDREDITGTGDNFVIYDPRDITPISRNGEPIREAPPRNLADLINQSRADRTQEAFNRQFVDKADEVLAAEKARPKDKIESVNQDEAEFRDMVEEYRGQGRVTAEDDASLKQADELAAWAERRAKAFEAAAGCIEAA